MTSNFPLTPQASTPQASTPQSSQVPQSQKVPPLESGDRLSHPEFERRYEAATHIRRAELIEGVVYVASPLRFQQHAEPHSALHGWLWTYQIATLGLHLEIKPTVRLDLDNEFQPDIALLLDESVGGQARLTEDGYLEGTPELVAEVAASSAAIDLGSKKQAYRRNGVMEYMVWQSYENQLEWFQWVEGEYCLLMPDETGVIRSQAFPGLWLPVKDLLTHNMVRVLEVVQAGARSPEHQAFVEAIAVR